MAPREAALVWQAAGATVSRAMLLAAEVFDAQAMLRHGFLTRLHAREELDTACRELALRIARLAPQAARLNKQTLRGSPGAAGNGNAYAYASLAEHREGITAFLAKRPPVF